VLCALLYTTSTRLRLNWVTRIWSLSSSIVVVHLQFSQSRGPRHWRRQCLCNWESVSCSDSKITIRSRILSSIIRIRCRSRNSILESGLQGVDSVSHWTSANITWLDYENVRAAVTNTIDNLLAWSFTKFSRVCIYWSQFSCMVEIKIWWRSNACSCFLADLERRTALSKHSFVTSEGVIRTKVILPLVLWYCWYTAVCLMDHLSKSGLPSKFSRWFRAA